ncbi:MAG TPA: hypothetical protein VHB77_13490 [Planctomycetaceae bacterium]|nr:hypothetical protein [Planctomycetaceae bacterium]
MNWIHNWLPLIVAVVFNSAANVLMKVGALPEVARPHGKLAYFNWAVALAIVLYIGNLTAYWITLNRLKVSVAFPIMTASSLIIVAISAALIPALHERISVMQLGGILVIIGGVWLLAAG